MIYELCRFSATALSLEQTADQCIQSARDNSRESQLLGAWRTEIGDLSCYGLPAAGLNR